MRTHRRTWEAEVSMGVDGSDGGSRCFDHEMVVTIEDVDVVEVDVGLSY